RINGESMHPEIKNGDTVIVKKQSDIDSGDIAIVLLNGNDATCKQIQKQQTGITLIGYNVGVYSPTFYTNEEIEDLPIVILGKVVEVRRKL
ncbi:LexA family protein, partial [Dialister micraerophilus]|uniref:LexA family protein n=1 Tax=Dialister micraerophilus TaxID=309120 RepID=UPI0023EFE0ED